jgi:hypothetical protein
MGLLRSPAGASFLATGVTPDPFLLTFSIFIQGRFV